MPDEEKEKKGFKKWLKWEERKVFLIVVAVIYGLAAAIFVWLWASDWLAYTYTDEAGKIVSINLWPWSWLTVVVVYTLFSFPTVDTTNRAVKTLFKRDIQSVEAGLTFTPRFIFDLIPFTKNVISLEVGTPQELTTRGEGGEILGATRVEPGKEIVRASQEPLRVTFATYERAIWQAKWHTREKTLTKEEKKEFVKETEALKGNEEFLKNDHLSRRLTSDPGVIAWFTIANPREFVRTMGKLERALPLMEKVIMVALQEYCSKRTLSFVLHNLEDAQDYLRDRLERLVGDPDAAERAEARKEPEGEINNWKLKESWGINIQGVKIKTMGLPLELNRAIRDARRAGYVKDATITKAEGERKRMEEEAAGKRADEREVLLGRMEGYKHLIELGLTAEQVLAADTGRAVAENVGNLFVTDSSVLANTIGAVAAGKEVLTGQPAPRLPKKRRPKTNSSGSPPAAPTP